jgi:hypothetical protein
LTSTDFGLLQKEVNEDTLTIGAGPKVTYDIGREQSPALRILGTETDTGILDLDANDRLVVTASNKVLLVRCKGVRVIPIEGLFGGDRVVVRCRRVFVQGSELCKTGPEQFRSDRDSTCNPSKSVSAL